MGCCLLLFVRRRSFGAEQKRSRETTYGGMASRFSQRVLFVLLVLLVRLVLVLFLFVLLTVIPVAIPFVLIQFVEFRKDGIDNVALGV